MSRLAARIAAKVKPWIPRPVLPYVHAVRSLPGGRPAVVTPNLRRVLVVAPHPDDETIACGGTLARLVDAGAVVTVVFATDGEATRGASAPPDEIARRRRGEARAACSVLGVDRVRHLGFADGSLAERRDELTEALRTIALEVVPDGVLVPWFLDGHPDHRAASLAAAAAVAPDVEVWAGETWTPVPATRIVDITAVFERKRRALEVHRTARLAFDTEAMLGLSRYRSVHGLMGAGYAEAFLVAPASDYLALAAASEDEPNTGVPT